MTRLIEILISLAIVAVLFVLVGLVLPSHRHLTKDIALTSLSIKSLLLKIRGYEHPLQEYAEDILVEEDGYVYIREPEEFIECDLD